MADFFFAKNYPTIGEKLDILARYVDWDIQANTDLSSLSFFCYNQSMVAQNVQTLLKSRRKEILAIAGMHGVTSIRVFGSVARGTEKAGSDIDFIVEVGPVHSRWFPAGLKIDLEALLGMPVDIVTPKALHWYIRDKVLEESKPL